jgi:hypothetical protein
MYYAYSDRKRNDFFILTNQGSSGSRKNENLHALYSILDYCEEPYLCRRKMQLNFLGEDFDEAMCKGMCDNCRQQVTVEETDRSKEALIAVRLVQMCMEYQEKITLKYVTELLRGKQAKKSVYQRGDFYDDFKGKLKHMRENDIKRMLVQLLIMRILKERFDMQTIRGTSVK